MKKKLNFLLGFLSFSFSAFAQDPKVVGEASKIPDFIFNPEFYVIVLIGLIVIISLLTLLRVVNVLTGILTNKQVEEYISESTTQEIALRRESWIATVWKKLNDSTPIEQERDILLDHDYDGIKELDNNLPPWWKYGFYLTILFSVGYMFHYHVIGTGKLQIAEYNNEMEKARIQQEEYRLFAANNIDETNVVKLTDEIEIKKGAEIYVQYCASCHGMVGEGNVGPNLTDEYWLHGGDIKDIFRVIKEGVPQKGMISWKQQLSPKQIQEVSSFIISNVGTNPPNAKEPQGEKFAYTEANNTNPMTEQK